MKKYLAALAVFIAATHLHASAAEHDLKQPLTLEQAAEEGRADAQEKLALSLIPEGDNPGDPHKAVYWFRKAAEQGRPRSQYYLATVLLGQGEKDEARIWLAKSARQNYPAAVAMLKRLHDPSRDGVLK